MYTTFAERAELFKQKATDTRSVEMKAEYLAKAESCLALSRDPVVIDVGIPCLFCGSTEGRSNDEGRGDGWYRCMSCQAC